MSKMRIKVEYEEATATVTVEAEGEAASDLLAAILACCEELSRRNSGEFTATILNKWLAIP